MARILVVDDESLIRVLVADVGESLGHEVLTAASIKEGQDRVARRGHRTAGCTAPGRGRARPCGDLCRPGRPDDHQRGTVTPTPPRRPARRGGASGGPLRVRDLSKALTQAVQWRNSRDSQSRSLLRHPDIIGESPALAEALEALREAAASNVNVLITGETGTGKELFASALHANSLRASGPFVTVDCTTLPETLVEAHLFGHARGAFTGADRAREGLLAAADHGTLFLDEVGELPLPVQGAFLRALELRRFRPVGEVREVESDFRLVAATNRDLDDMVGMDLYRSDLRFRLRGMTIHVPPLRRRAEDIPLLAEHFTARYCQRHELPNKELTPDCYAMLADYSWPGNVRELRHTIERACAAAGDGTQLFTRHLPTEIRIELARKRLVHLSEPEESAPAAPLPEQEPSTQPRKPETFPTLRDMKAKAEREYIAGLFAACQGDVRRAAGIAGVSRGHFYELLKKYGLDRTSSIPEFPAI
ncbi:MAG: sigma-54 dependent transcriptional regulator [Bilophila wadsworthia]